MDNQRPKILILGVGNILLSDEGVGVRVIEYLQTQPLPPGIELVDGGTAGADLIDVLAERDTVIIIDAVQADHPPGTILKLTPDDLLPQMDNPLSLHDLDIPQTLSMTKILNCAPERVVCIGVVPENINPGMELTKTIGGLIPQIGQIILDQLP